MSFKILVSDLFIITEQSSLNHKFSESAKSQLCREKVMRAVLLVEDSPAQQKMISTILTKNGWQVMIAEDGIQALESINESSLDLIVLDIVMPKMNGYEVCRRIKTNPKTQNVPIVMCSSKGEEFDRYWGMKQGADAYIAKPFEDVELIGTIQQLLRH
ncbi:Response regulator receiver [Crocosphaera watsonii WH 8501]|uniref:Response regulator receiver n=2 Tax=Crocosphaera watsonii TaxID=263511 RepID=Q4BUY4_CROWT|nr:Response regulator receiver [Crocosphaera watsonii WH 8501]